jgi:Flp pilus assembly pilin Flp
MLLLTEVSWECELKRREMLEHVIGSLQAVTRLLGGEEGQDMMEYGLLAALIAPLVIVVILLIGPELTLYFQNVVDAIPK